MASKMTNKGPHSAGIFADMTVDGPEIGTLVVIVDRGKNLPNRKTMGKQNPYCAARLGKEARKTEVDKRGGQTPRWDQELRFTVHDSPDYYNLKISVFSEDKKTDLIGEAWVALDDVVVPGGGKGDLWQGLTCKGKYAGELRIELTYYDTREKPEAKLESVSMADELKQQYGTLNPKVKRRPLPTNPNAPVTTDVMIPERPMPGRAKHGPRDFQTPSRATSLPPKTYNYPQSEATLFGQSPVHPHSQGASPAPLPQSEPLPSQHSVRADQNSDRQHYEAYSPASAPPDLPELTPSVRQQSQPPRPRHPQQRQSTQPHPQQRPLSHVGIPHSHSASTVPVTYEPRAYDDSYQPPTDHPGPVPDTDRHYQPARQRRNGVPPGWQDEYGGIYSDKQAYVEDEQDGPPPPPAHSYSSPAVPQAGSSYQTQAMSKYVATPPSARQQYVQNSSPLQDIDRGYAQQTPQSYGHPRRGQSFDEYGGEFPYQGSHHSTPNLSSPSSQGPSSNSRTSPYERAYPARQSMAEMHGTPSRQPHPLSQEVLRAKSPNPYRTSEQSPGPHPSFRHSYQERGVAPLIKPRAISPQPAPQSPQPASAPRNLYSLQFPVRSFESSDRSPLSTSASSTSKTLPRKSVSPRPSISEEHRSAIPFSPDSFGVHNPSVPAAEAEARRGPIVGWHGQEIDPSDHLPVAAWAPEPEKKTPTKTYAMGRERDFGPRNLSKDTVIKVRIKPGANQPEQQSQPARRGVLKNSPSPGQGSHQDYANFNPVPNPYEQQHEQYSRGYGAPSLPPKVPLTHSPQEYASDALSRELSTIDIGSSRHRPSPAAYVPVRSHRDRNTYY